MRPNDLETDLEGDVPAADVPEGGLSYVAPSPPRVAAHPDPSFRAFFQGLIDSEDPDPNGSSGFPKPVRDILELIALRQPLNPNPTVPQDIDDFASEDPTGEAGDDMDVDGSPERIVSIEPLLNELVELIEAIPEERRIINGEVRSGREVASAIPHPSAFLGELSRLDGPRFVEFNKDGCLVLAGSPLPPTRTAVEALMAVRRVVYTGVDGNPVHMSGDELYGESPAIDAIDPNSVLMDRGWPTIKVSGAPGHPEFSGELPRMFSRGFFLDRQGLNAWLDGKGTWNPDEVRVFADGNTRDDRVTLVHGHTFSEDVSTAYVYSIDTPNLAPHASIPVLRVKLRFNY